MVHLSSGCADKLLGLGQGHTAYNWQGMDCKSSVQVPLFDVSPLSKYYSFPIPVAEEEWRHGGNGRVGRGDLHSVGGHRMIGMQQAYQSILVLLVLANLFLHDPLGL